MTGVRAALLLLLFGLFLALLAAEGAARVAERFRCRDQLGGFTVRNRLYGWGNRPGARGWMQRCVGGKPEWHVHTRINGRGLRDRDVPYERSGASRILVLGDSFTVGTQVAEERTYPKLLEQRLSAAAGAGARFEVLNAGVHGWGTDNELLFYRHEGRKYHADLVLLAFTTVNDVFENARRLVAVSPFWADKPYFAFLDGRLVLQNFPLAPQSLRVAALRQTASTLVLHSGLFRLVADGTPLGPFLRLPPPPRPADAAPVDTFEVYLADYPERWREAWRITRGLLIELAREVEADGSRFAVAIVNGREEVSPSRWTLVHSWSAAIRGAACDVDKPNRLLVRFLARRGIPTIPLLEDFRARFAADGTPGFFAWDMHWAPAGHELAAEGIARRLDELGLVPGRAARPARRSAVAPAGEESGDAESRT